jgi:hypothetical protein
MREAAAHTERLVKARSTVAKWSHHLAVGTLPPHLKGSAPKIQFTAGYATTEAAKAAQKTIDDEHAAHQIATLTKSIATRADEVKWLEAETAPERVVAEMRAHLAPLGITVAARYKLPVETRDALGVVTHVEMVQAPAAIAIRDSVMEDCGIYASCVISMVLNRAEAMDRKIEKKRAVASAATVAANDGDAVMGDATLTSAIAKEVKRQVMGVMPRENRKPKGNAQVKAAKVSANLDRYTCIADFFAEGSRGGPGQSHPSRQEKDVRVSPSLVPSRLSYALRSTHVQERRRIEEEEGRKARQARTAGGSGQGRRISAAAAACIEEVEREEEGAAVASHSQLDSYVNPPGGITGNLYNRKVVLDERDARGHPPLIASGDLWIAQPKTMPDFITSLPLPEAAQYVLSQCSLNWLDSMRFQQYVHQSPGTIVPRDIAFQLSLGAKYMFHQPTNATLIHGAWMDFQRRLRWRILFMFEGDDTQVYDPDYDTRGPSEKAPPKLPQYIELGLVKGRIFAHKAMSKVPDSEDSLTSVGTTYKPNTRAIHDFLTSNEYVVTGTDKNLGIAVSRRDWIIEKCQDILSNVNDYRRIEHIDAINILDKKCSEMRVLADFANDRHSLGKQLATFLRSKVTLGGKAHHIPKFYGIPKIHKVPTKMRPIIPCHSAIMNPAAKYISKTLKPIIESAPTIIHGTKDLAQKLSKLNIDPSRNWYIVTGDVVAFYPNIPLSRCMDIVCELYFEHYWADRDDRYEPYNEALQRFFADALRTGNTQLLTQFQGVIYEQLNGLAMGVADSPDLANLFGYYFERRSGVLDHPNIFYYGRYIDDCLAIVYADSNQAAVTLLQSLIQFDNCVIEWAPPGSSQPFLDMLLYRDGNNKLQHMPYRKAGSHQERIPWISAHPIDVKRGTFLGEMSRLATLSSTHTHYLEAMRGLVALYIHRGYPVNEVHKWLHSNLSVRWNNRLAERPAQTDATTLVLKSEYNLAWNYFNAHEFGQTIFNYWREWLERANTGNFNMEYPPPPASEEPVLIDGIPLIKWDLRETNIFNSRVLVSRKRTRNFLDLTNLWKKTVLETMEDSVLDNLVDNAARIFTYKRPLDYDVNTLVTGPRPIKRSRVDYTDEEIQFHRRSTSPRTTDAWRSGATSTWGRGRLGL